jgi:hypothetical protein
MAKEPKEHEGGKKPRKHLHEIRTTAADDGTYVHHETYKAKKEDAHTEPERQNVATSTNADEAGQYVGDRMAMNEQGGGAEEEPGAGGEGAQGAEEPAAGTMA